MQHGAVWRQNRPGERGRGEQFHLSTSVCSPNTTRLSRIFLTAAWCFMLFDGCLSVSRRFVSAAAQPRDECGGDSTKRLRVGRIRRGLHQWVAGVNAPADRGI